jgi:hypothetical protein
MQCLTAQFNQAAFLAPFEAPRGLRATNALEGSFCGGTVCAEIHFRDKNDV